MRNHAHVLHKHGGSPIKNSRVKLTNVKDCLKRGLVKEGQDPLAVAAEQRFEHVEVFGFVIGAQDSHGVPAFLGMNRAISEMKVSVTMGFSM